MEQLGSHWTDFRETWYWRIFRKSVEKIEVSSKSVKNKKYFTWRPMQIFKLYLAYFFLEREMLKTNVEKIKTHILYSVTFFRKSRRLWENVEKYCRVGQGTDYIMAHAHCMPDTYGYNYIHSQYVILIAFLLRQWLHERASVLRYTYIPVLLTYSRVYTPS